jgi:putative colanic acid biosynthesis acetyltransferase WcaF
MLNLYDNKSYYPGGGVAKRIAWYIFSILFFKTSIPVPSFFKLIILDLFGATVGSNIVIKPNVHIKYPWFLTIGNHSWIGEGVWIDNLAMVTIGNNVCLSQSCYLLTGNHNYKSVEFRLTTGKITLEDGVWLGSKSIVCPGITCKSHSVLTVSSVATNNLEGFGIYQGNPAIFKKKRIVL